IDVNIEETAEAVARKSDILVTLTTKERDSPPLVLNDWIRDGTHINAVGGDSYRQIELEQSLLRRSKIVVDFIEDAIIEGESHQLRNELIPAQLSQLVAGNESIRNDEIDITIFDSVGFGLLDLQSYKLVYKL